MGQIRDFLRERRWLAIGLVVTALCIKALLPGGYMLASQGVVLTVQICSDASGGADTRQIAIPQKSVPGDGQGAPAKGDGHCPYTALSLAALSAADPALLTLAIAFILALGLLPARPDAPRPVHRLRPPLRGPPGSA